MESIKVGLLGLGVVGGGTWKVLARNAGEISRRAGRSIEVNTRSGQRHRQSTHFAGAGRRTGN